MNRSHPPLTEECPLSRALPVEDGAPLRLRIGPIVLSYSAAEAGRGISGVCGDLPGVLVADDTAKRRGR